MKRLCYIFLLLLVSAPFSRSSAQWVSAGTIPGTARDGGVAFALGNKLYFGGGGDRTFYEYDPASNRWTQKAPIPGVTASRAFAASFAIDGKGYICGGIDGNVILNDLWQYDPVKNVWTRKHDFPGKPRAAALSFAIGGDGYLGGGADTTNAFLDFYVYDPLSDVWAQTGVIPEIGMSFPASFVIGNYGYVSAFATYGSGAEKESTHLWRYDPFNNGWKQLADFPGAARQAATAFALNGMGYVGQGQTAYTSALSDFYIYNPMNDTWRPDETKLSPSPRAWSSAVTLGDKAYVGWGWDLVGSFDNDLWVLPSTNAGVQSTSEAPLSIYPNPATEWLRVNEPGTSTVTILNSVGATMLRAHAADGLIDIRKLEPGAYWLVLESPAGRHVQRLIKR